MESWVEPQADFVCKAPMKHAIFTLAALGLAGPAFAGTATQPTTVYELFTSQGCSSCPPANAEIDKLSTKDDVLALSYGVTYWDYLGWKDTFARPEFTKRQRDYVRALGARNAYTPQVVLNGASHNSRARKLGAPGEIGQDLAITETGGRLQATGSGKAILLAYTPGRQDVPVKRGENGGRTVSVTNVVTDMMEVELPYSFKPEADLAYALLQHGEDAAITSAAAWTP